MNIELLLNLLSSLIIFASFFLLIYLTYYWSFYWQNYKHRFSLKTLNRQNLFPFYKKLRHLKKNRYLYIFLSFLICFAIYLLFYFNLLKCFSFIFKNYPVSINFSFAIPLIILNLFSQYLILIVNHFLNLFEILTKKTIHNFTLLITQSLSQVKINFKYFKLIISEIFISKLN